jgi:hypothetical protein
MKCTYLEDNHLRNCMSTALRIHNMFTFFSKTTRPTLMFLIWIWWSVLVGFVGMSKPLDMLEVSTLGTLILDVTSTLYFTWIICIVDSSMLWWDWPTCPNSPHTYTQKRKRKVPWSPIELWVFEVWQPFWSQMFTLKMLGPLSKHSLLWAMLWPFKLSQLQRKIQYSQIFALEL